MHVVTVVAYLDIHFDVSVIIVEVTETAVYGSHMNRGLFGGRVKARF